MSVSVKYERAGVKPAIDRGKRRVKEKECESDGRAGRDERGVEGGRGLSTSPFAPATTGVCSFHSGIFLPPVSLPPIVSSIFDFPFLLTADRGERLSRFAGRFLKTWKRQATDPIFAIYLPLQFVKPISRRSRRSTIPNGDGIAGESFLINPSNLHTSRAESANGTERSIKRATLSRVVCVRARVSKKLTRRCFVVLR